MNSTPKLGILGVFYPFKVFSLDVLFKKFPFSSRLRPYAGDLILKCF